MKKQETTIQEINGEEATKLSKGNVYVGSGYSYQQAYQVEKNGKKYIIVGTQDDYAENPCEWYEGVCNFNLYHDRYNLTCNGDIDIDFNENIEKQIEKYEKQGYWLLPVYMYDHSGIALNTGGFSCSWDGGLVGWISISKEQRKAEHITRRKKWYDLVDSVVKKYGQYLNGNVYMFKTYDIEKGVDNEYLGNWYGDYMEEALKDYIRNEL